MAGQNVSSAVMAQRFNAADALDFFPTPGWGTRALCEYVIDIRGARIVEPACGRGHMVRPLAEYAGTVITATDIQDMGYGGVFDFLSIADDVTPPFGPVDWVITNPPFNQLHQFAHAALKIANRGVALLGRLQMLETVGRWQNIFQPYDGHWTVAPFVERLPMEEGCVSPDTSTATAYAWLIIDKLVARPSPLVHIPPCRARLERASDYDSPEFVAQVRAIKKARAEEDKKAREEKGRTSRVGSGRGGANAVTPIDVAAKPRLRRVA